MKIWRVLYECNENSQYIKGSRGKNFYYHEIIFLEKREDIKLATYKEALFDLAYRYIGKRAENSLAYGRVHNDHNHHIHIHLAISSNPFQSHKRHVISKKELRTFQMELEDYLFENYPTLQSKRVYNYDKSRMLEKNIPDGEFYSQKRGKTKKAVMKELLKSIFKESKNQGEFEKKLEEAGLKLYQRGQTIGVTKLETGKSQRFKTLGVLDKYNFMVEKWKRFERLNQRTKTREQEQSLEPELNLSESERRKRGHGKGYREGGLD